MAETPMHTVRMADELWDRFGEVAAAVGDDRAALIRRFVMWYLRYPGVTMPLRPSEALGSGTWTWEPPNESLLM